MRVLQTFSTTAADNGTADPTIAAQELQAAGTVNNGVRALMARLAAYFNGVCGAITLGGTGDAFTFTSPSGHALTAIAAPLTIWAKTPRANAGASVTLAIDGLTAVNVKRQGGGSLEANDMIANGIYGFAYDGAQLVLLNPEMAGEIADHEAASDPHTQYVLESAYTAADVLSKLHTVDGAGSGLDADLLDGQHGSYYLAASSYTAADVLSKLLTVDGAGSGLDADLLDGLNSTAFAQIASSPAFTGGVVTVTRVGADATFETFRNEVHGSNAFIGIHRFYGKDSAANTQQYGYCYCYVTDDTSGSEDSKFVWGHMVGGSSTEPMTLEGNNLTLTGTVTGSSDRRLKDNIRPIEAALDLVKQIEGRRFRKNGVEAIGFIAQDLRAVVPEVVFGDEDKGMLSVSYGEITAVLVEAVKMLTARVEALEAGR